MFGKNFFVSIACFCLTVLGRIHPATGHCYPREICFLAFDAHRFGCKHEPLLTMTLLTMRSIVNKGDTSQRHGTDRSTKTYENLWIDYHHLFILFGHALEENNIFTTNPFMIWLLFNAIHMRLDVKIEGSLGKYNDGIITGGLRMRCRLRLPRSESECIVHELVIWLCNWDGGVHDPLDGLNEWFGRFFLHFIDNFSFSVFNFAKVWFEGWQK